MREFKNIIFDLGGVIFDIDYKKTIEAFRSLGIKNAETFYSKSSQINLFNDLEKGNLPESEFYSGIRKLSNTDIDDDQIKDAWNALLIGLPTENVELLRELRKKHRIFLLSNTNSIHEKAYREMISKQYGSFIFDDLFEKMYLSHHLHMRKPDPEIFQFVLNDSGLLKSETCFIDDSPQHIESAMRLGIKSIHLKNKSISELVLENPV